MSASTPWRLLSIASFAFLCLGCPGEERDAARDTVPAWPMADLVDVEILGEERIVVIASTGEIHLSRDGGRSWQAAAGSVPQRLHDIEMVDTEVGWVVGDDVMLKTVDGGATWRMVVFPRRLPSPGLLGVAALDRERVIVVGEGGTRLLTEDGGTVWREVSLEPDVVDPLHSDPIAAIDCARNVPGTCTTVGTTIHRTVDGGQSWTRVEVVDADAIEPIRFAAGQVEVGSIGLGRRVASIEARASSVDREWRIEPEIGPEEMLQIERRNDPQASFALIDARLDEVRTRLEDARVAPGRVVVVGGPPWDYEDYLDDDPHLLERYWQERAGAASSVRIRVVESPRLKDVSFTESGAGFAVGQDGVLIRSDDAGESWRATKSPSAHDLEGVAASDGRVVVVGAQGVSRTSALRTFSEGQGEWTDAPGQGGRAFFDTLRAVSFAPGGRIGMIVGERGRLLRSLDGGATWHVVAREERGGIDTPTQGRHSVVR